MSNILDFEFEEMALIVLDGIEAVYISGMAEIAYSRDGSWDIESISVEGRQELTPEQRTAGKKPWIYIKPPAELDHLIFDRLMSDDWIGKIDNAVREQLLTDRDDAREAQYDARRDDALWFGVE